MSEDIFSQKAAIRNEILARRDALSSEARREKSVLIGKKLAAFFHRAFCKQGDDPSSSLKGKKIAVFAAMKSEVSLDTFIQQAYREEAHVYFPCMTKRSNGAVETDLKACSSKSSSYMLFREVPFGSYEKRRLDNTYTIPFIDHPLQSFFLNDEALAAFPPLKNTELDGVVVPLVAFDKQFNRLGYGGGNYDSFLANTSTQAVVVGVAFDEQKVPQVPLEEHDQALPVIISA